MAEVTQKPDNLPSTNALDGVDDPDQAAQDSRADIYLSGAHVATLNGPPAMGERVLLLTEVEVTEVGHRSTDGGETLTAVRKVRRVGDMWRSGDRRPEPKKTQAELDAEAEAAAAENQPPLYGDDDPIGDE